jgi:hypothetical protein
VTPALAQEQAADAEFDVSVKEPAYASDGPRVLFDEAHRNFHTAGGRYKPFADLIKNDGHRIIPTTRRKVTKELLSEYEIMVISNALGATREIDSAFSNSECDAIRDWVNEGGALLLIADHYPMGHAAESLAKRFDVLMSKGATDEYEFTADNGLGVKHPIMRGRSNEEEIRKVRTFTGQSIRGPAGAASLLRLPAGAKELVPDATNPGDRSKAKEGPAVYPDQGVAFTFGKGRVVVLGEAGMLTAQKSAQGAKFGMNVAGIDNRQLALDIMHWLSGLLPEGVE